MIEVKILRGSELRDNTFGVSKNKSLDKAIEEYINEGWTLAQVGGGKYFLAAVMTREKPEGES